MKKILFLIIYLINFCNFIKPEIIERPVIINGEQCLLKIDQDPNLKVGKIQIFTKNNNEIGSLDFGSEKNFTEIKVIFVNKEFRNKGFGQFLINYFCVMAYLKNPENQIKLSVSPLETDNPEEIQRLIKFYKKLGFIQAGKDEFKHIKMVYDRKRILEKIRESIYKKAKILISKKDNQRRIEQISNLILEF